MSFVRLKYRTEGKNRYGPYAELVENQWIGGTVKQTFIEYLGTPGADMSKGGANPDGSVEYVDKIRAEVEERYEKEGIQRHDEYRIPQEVGYSVNGNDVNITGTGKAHDCHQNSRMYAVRENKKRGKDEPKMEVHGGYAYVRDIKPYPESFSKPKDMPQSKWDSMWSGDQAKVGTPNYQTSAVWHFWNKDSKTGQITDVTLSRTDTVRGRQIVGYRGVKLEDKWAKTPVKHWEDIHKMMDKENLHGR